MSFLSVVFACLAGFILISADNLNNVLFNGDYEFIDLTHPFDNNTVYWLNTQSFVFTKKTEGNIINGNWYASNEFAAGEHGGTHLDAPYHFFESGAHVGELPLEKLIVPLIIVDISGKVNGDPNFVLYKHHLDYILNDNLGKPCVLIFKFGWSQYFGDRKKYLGLDEQKQTLNFPGLSGEMAEWITSSHKNVVGIGVDTASVDSGSSQDYPVHQINAKHGLYHMENVNLSKPVPEYGCTALVMPMKIAEGTGAPLRLVAICPKKQPDKF
ncbi:isatin hydrolase-like [Pectinophora gossypiella]|uniref:isatin hydrolase-like n=1 Tax=Pectinophora gossypiella TaxID=13191 RepID=UPI00214F240F|nr:isatin hydrolase-like [Pectinophora gossypiella]